MKRLKLARLVALAAAGSALPAVAAPVLENLAVKPVEGAPTVRVNYTLSQGPAIVTVDILTNGYSVGGAATRTAAGDINRLLENGDHSFYWTPNESWPAGINPYSASFAVKAWSTDDPPPYMAVNLIITNGVVIRHYPSADAFPGEGGITNIRYKTDWLVMRKIPAKDVTWTMGLNEKDANKDGANRSTAHKVTFSKNFYVGVYTLTTRQASCLYPSSGNYYWANATNALPYSNFTFSALRGDATEDDGAYNWPTSKKVKENSILGTLRAHTGIDFDLTTDAQWEYACRAGEPAAFNNGLNSCNASDAAVLASFREIAWCDVESVQPVGLLKPNNWGLYDMHGNVWEVCRDWCRTTLVDETDPEGAETATNPPTFSANGFTTVTTADGGTETGGRVIRGCYYSNLKNGMKYFRSAHRNYSSGVKVGAQAGVRFSCPCPALQ